MNEYQGHWVVFLLIIITITVCCMFAVQLAEWEGVWGSPTADETFSLIEMDVSGFCSDVCCCGEWADGYTASGVAAKGFICAAPPEYPFGTLMDVPGHGCVVVLDRGGAIVGNKLDLLFEAKDGVSGHERALQWGRQTLTVKVWE